MHLFTKLNDLSRVLYLTKLQPPPVLATELAVITLLSYQGLKVSLIFSLFSNINIKFHVHTPAVWRL